jgi:hypothetical protein
MTSREAEPTTIGLSDVAHVRLRKLKEDGHFAEMADAYRFAIGLALAHGISPDPIAGSRTTIFNIGTLDPDGSIRTAVATLREPSDEPVYRSAERYAEWGVTELSRRAETGTLSLAEVLREAEALSEE